MILQKRKSLLQELICVYFTTFPNLVRLSGMKMISSAGNDTTMFSHNYQ